MSAGFEFAKKHEITICGRAYPCDISDKRMLEGVTRDFPRVLQAAQAFCAMDAKLKPGGQDGRSADTMAQEALEKFSDAVAMSVCTFALWAACFILTYTFPMLNSGLGAAGTFCLLRLFCLFQFCPAFCNGLSAAFCLCVPLFGSGSSGLGHAGSKIPYSL